MAVKRNAAISQQKPSRITKSMVEFHFGEGRNQMAKPPRKMMLLPALMLPLFLTALTSSGHAPHNYTWMVLNRQGEVIWSTSQTVSTAPWPTLTPELCHLAMGLTIDFGSFEVEYETDLKIAPEKPGKRDWVGGCLNHKKHSYLRNMYIYVCPGPHRDLKDKPIKNNCGGQYEYYCKNWGCETTGDAYWNSSLSWDYITVKAGYTIRRHQVHNLIPNCSKKNAKIKGWCSPLKISFTKAGKKVTEMNGLK